MLRGRRWHQYSTRQLLLLTALFGVAIVLLLRNTRGTRAVKSLQALGAEVSYRGQKPGWLEAIFGRATFQPVSKVICKGPQFGDEHLHYLLDLSGLQQLSLAQSRVTDAGLAQISRLNELIILNLKGTNVSSEGLRHLQEIDTLRDLDVGESLVADDDLKQLESCKTALIAISEVGE